MSGPTNESRTFVGDAVGDAGADVGPLRVALSSCGEPAHAALSATIRETVVTARSRFRYISRV